MVGTPINEKTSMSLGMVVIIIGAVVAVVAPSVGLYWTSVTRLDAHLSDCGIHHSTEQLDGRYMLKQTSDERYERLSQTMDRIEGKLDKLTGGSR